MPGFASFRRLSTPCPVMMMARSMAPLPQLQGIPLLSDGGLETTLVFHHGIDLPEFAAFDLLRRERGREVLRDTFRTDLQLARETGLRQSPRR